MSKVKVNEFHKVTHEQHHKLAASHKTMMDEHEEGTPAHLHHKTAHEAHSAISEFHKACMEKSVGDDMNKGTVPASLESAVQAVFLKMFGNAVMPTNVSAVAPPNRAVPRPGMQPVPERPNVPEQFAKLVAVDESEEQDRM
jgi:hypothetical protein